MIKIWAHQLHQDGLVWEHKQQYKCSQVLFHNPQWCMKYMNFFHPSPTHLKPVRDALNAQPVRWSNNNCTTVVKLKCWPPSLRTGWWVENRKRGQYRFSLLLYFWHLTEYRDNICEWPCPVYVVQYAVSLHFAWSLLQWGSAQMMRVAAEEKGDRQRRADSQRLLQVHVNFIRPVYFVFFGRKGSAHEKLNTSLPFVNTPTPSDAILIRLFWTCTSPLARNEHKKWNYWLNYEVISFTFQFMPIKRLYC